VHDGSVSSPPGIVLWIVIVGWLAWVMWLARRWYYQLSDVREANRTSKVSPGRDEEPLSS